MNLIVWPLLISAVASIVVSLFIENARRPVLVVEGPHSQPVNFRDNDEAAGAGVSFRLRVRNRAPSRLLAFFLQRHVARSCRARLRFVSRDGEALTLPPMEGRWADAVPPDPLVGWVGSNREKVVLYDPARFSAASRVDIGPGSSEVLDVAVQLEHDASPFGWTNTSFQYGGRHPEYQLGVGMHEVEVTVETDGVTVTQRVSMMIGVRREASPALPPSPLPPLQAPITESIARPG